ncbi:sterol-binding protein, partial [Mesorhizobium sp. M7A.F.Ca.US.006.01.1.1]
IKLSLDDLDSLIAGDLNPTMAFMTGKIKVEGDMTVAMALSQLIG